MRSFSALLLVCLLVCCSFLYVTAGQTEAEMFAAIAKKRADTPPEEVARQLADNTIMDADLLPTQPAPKDYKPTGEPEFALLMTPGRGKGCNLKKYTALMEFLREDAHFYPSLLVDYAIAVDPKLKFYATKELRDAALIHGSELSEEDLLALLMAGPDETKEPLLHVSLADETMSIDTIKQLMADHGLKRAMEGDDNHSSRLIFKADFVPIED